MSDSPYCRDLVCPRCGKKEVIKSDVTAERSKRIQLKCDSCALELVGDNWVDMKSIWEVPKKKRLDYAIRALKSFENTYVGRFTLEVWKNSNICKYLSEEIGSCVKKRKPQEVSGGIVLYIDR